MQVKRYEVNNIQEAMTRIKDDLGPDAIIISTKTIRKSHPRLIEVVAAVDRMGPVSPERNRDSNFSNSAQYQEFLADMGKQIHEVKQLLIEAHRLRSVEEELARLREGLETVIELVGMVNTDTSKDLTVKAYRILIRNGVSKFMAAHLISRVRRDPRSARAKHVEDILTLVEEHLCTVLPSRKRDSDFPRVTIAVGPTGVGKTTTVAKLAARYHIFKKKKTGLITADTYRIGAVDQLNAYAKILGIPLIVARNSDEFHRALQRLSDREVILVDTQGKSPRDSKYIRHLKEFFAPVPSAHIHLLINPGIGVENLIETAELYRELDFNEILFTKIDECQRFGGVCDVLARTGRPVSFITNGQAVPEDIREVSTADMASLIVRSSLH